MPQWPGFPKRRRSGNAIPTTTTSVFCFKGVFADSSFIFNNFFFCLSAFLCFEFRYTLGLLHDCHPKNAVPELALRHSTRRTMPVATKKRRMVSYDQNGRMKKDAPEASSKKPKVGEKPKVEEKPKSTGETREARLAKMSQTVKSNFESDLERIVHAKGSKGGP